MKKPNHVYQILALLNMLEEASCISKDPSVLRRLIFAASNLSKDMPKYWNFVSDFGFKFSKNDFKVNEVKLLLENIDFIDQQAFDTDKVLYMNLIILKDFKEILWE